MANKLLKEMISDENMAPKQYRKLSKTLKYKEDRRVIRGIIKQERQHKAKLLKMRRREWKDYQ